MDDSFYLKKAIRDRERSSSTVREEAKIALRTAGVTGMRLVEPSGGDGRGGGDAAALRTPCPLDLA